MAKYTSNLNLEIPEYTDNADVPALEERNNTIIDETIGDLSDLETEDKSSLVGAINEANQHGSGGGGGETLPIGAIKLYGGSTAPEGYMFCDGSAISRTEYATLFSVIGTTYGSGDGSTTFNLPDFRGRVPVGLDSSDTDFDTLGETGGEKEHLLTVTEMPSHQHGEYVNSSSGSRYPYALGNGGGSSTSGNWFSSTNIFGNITGPQVLTGATGGGQAHNNVQPYIVLNYIIKVSQTTSVQAQKIANFFGDVIGSDGTYNASCYSKVTATKISFDGIWKFDIQGQLGGSPSSAVDYYNWGFMPSKLSSLLNTAIGVQVAYDSTLKEKSSYRVFNTDGTLDTVAMGYGTTFEYNDNAYLLPARYYTTTGSVGGWGFAKFIVGQMFEATIYLREV